MNHRIALVLVLLPLAACTRETPDEPAENPARPAQPRPERLSRERPCESAPRWTEIEGRCEADEFVYGVASAAGIPNASMRVHIASDYARAALTDASGTTVLTRTEVLDLAACEDSTWALARRPKDPEEAPLAECGDAVTDRASPPEGCPEWSTALAVLDGDKVHGVGYVVGMKNPSMARTVASNRAVAEQRKTFGLQVTRSDDGSISTGTTSQVMALQEGALVATCGDITVAKVTSRVLESPPFDSGAPRPAQDEPSGR